MKTTINERIKMLRTHLSMTAEEFAGVIDITSTQLSRIENAKVEPQHNTIQKILDSISISREWLMEGKGELKAQVKNKESEAGSPWKDEAYTLLREQLAKKDKLIEWLQGLVNQKSFRAALKATGSD